MLDEEGSETQQSKEAFYRRAEKTLLTCPVFIGISVHVCCFPAVRLHCHDLVGYGFGGRRRPEPDSCSLFNTYFERERRLLP